MSSFSTKKQKNHPTEGYFVAVWEFGGLPWCATFRWTKSGNLKFYDINKGKFKHCGDSYNYVLNDPKARFFVS
jgi:hypothetical protein